MKQITIIRHVDIEGPGTLGEFLETKNVPYRILDVFKDNAAELFSLDWQKTGAVVVLGGPMNVYEEEKHPFLRQEKIFIAEAVMRKIPFIGICLGAQLLACALGAKVRRGPMKEIGWYRLKLEPQAKKDVLLKELNPEIDVFQWHEDTFDLPRGATLLAKNNAMNQAFCVNDCAWGLQFHLEVDLPTIESWYEAYLKEGNSDSSWKDRYFQIKHEFDQNAQSIYQNFLALACS